MNWKTTTLGIMAIAGTLIHLATAIMNGQINQAEITADIAGITAGWGLIHASDAK